MGRPIETKKKAASARRKMGRPSKYTLALADKVCSYLANGESMREVERKKGMPSMVTIFAWIRKHPEFLKQYEIAKQEAADAMTEDMQDIADNQVSQPLLIEGKPVVIEGKTVMVTDSASVAHARLRVDTRKWAASKLKPKKYGDRISQEHTGSLTIGGILSEISGKSSGLPRDD